MKEEIIEKIITNSGKVTRDSSHLLEAVFPTDKTDKAVHVFFEITEGFKQKAVLSGGNKLAVYIQ
jgi:hypothetical protein